MWKVLNGLRKYEQRIKLYEKVWKKEHETNTWTSMKMHEQILKSMRTYEKVW